MIQTYPRRWVTREEIAEIHDQLAKKAMNENDKEEFATQMCQAKLYREIENRDRRKLLAQ